MLKIFTQTPPTDGLVRRPNERPDETATASLQSRFSGRGSCGVPAAPGFFGSLSSISSSIALRFGGFTASLEAMIDPITRPIPQKLAADFFSRRLPEIAELAEKNPAAAHRIISARMHSSPRLWRNLMLVGCGNGGALAHALDDIESSPHSDSRSMADCVLAVSRQRPQEGKHLIRHSFAHADLPAQIYMLGTLVADESAGTTTLVGDLFLKMMEGSTAVEREEAIYPALNQMIAGNAGSKSPRRGFLGALFRGWLSECPS